jgi:hypothetical protein
MSTQPVDYTALARQAGAVSSQPPGGGSIDYAALAKQAGALSSEPAASSQVSGWLDSVERFGKGFYANTIEPFVDIGAGAAHAVAHPLRTASDVANSPMVQHPVDTTVKAAQDAWNTHMQMIDQARQSLEKGDYDDAIQRGTNALIPVLGPSIQASVDKAKKGNVAEALGELSGMATSLVSMAPGTVESVVSKLHVPETSLPEKLYQSALKPSQVNPERAAAAVQTGLENAIPISDAGQAKLAGLIQDLSGKVRSVIASDPTATVDPAAAASRLSDVRSRFANQAVPQNDLAVIDKARNDFLAAHPGEGELPGGGPLPAAEAQSIKQGTYAQLKSKAYGEMKTAQIESEKALARGLKEELEAQFPELKILNAKQGEFYGLEPYLEKAVARIGNHNVISLGDMAAAGAGGAMAGGPGAAAATLMRQTLGSPQVKSRLAIALNSAQNARGAREAFAATVARVNRYVQGLDAAVSPTMGIPAVASPALASGNQEQQ